MAEKISKAALAKEISNGSSIIPAPKKDVDYRPMIQEISRMHDRFLDTLNQALSGVDKGNTVVQTVDIQKLLDENRSHFERLIADLQSSICKKPDVEVTVERNHRQQIVKLTAKQVD